MNILKILTGIVSIANLKSTTTKIGGVLLGGSAIAAQQTQPQNVEEYIMIVVPAIVGLLLALYNENKASHH